MSFTSLNLDMFSHLALCLHMMLPHFRLSPVSIPASQTELSPIAFAVYLTNDEFMDVGVPPEANVIKRFTAVIYKLSL